MCTAWSEPSLCVKRAERSSGSSRHSGSCQQNSPPRATSYGSSASRYSRTPSIVFTACDTSVDEMIGDARPHAARADCLDELLDRQRAIRHRGVRVTVDRSPAGHGLDGWNGSKCVRAVSGLGGGRCGHRCGVRAHGVHVDGLAAERCWLRAGAGCAESAAAPNWPAHCCTGSVPSM